MTGTRRVRVLNRVAVGCLLVVAAAAVALSLAAGAGAGAPPAVAHGLITTTAPKAGPAGAAPAFPFGAVTLFDNFGPSNAYNCCAGWTEGGPSSFPGLVKQAMGFTPGTSASVGQIDLALGNAAGTNGATIQLEADNNGPGRALGTWSVSGQPAFGTCCTVTTITANPPILVYAHQRYWLSAFLGGTDADTWDVWNDNSVGQVGPVASDTGSGWSVETDSEGAFDVLATCKLCRAG